MQRLAPAALAELPPHLHARSTHTQRQPAGRVRPAAQYSSAGALSASCETTTRQLCRVAAGGGEWLCPLPACLYPEENDESEYEARQLAARTEQAEEERQRPAAHPGDAAPQQRQQQQQPVAPSGACEVSSPISTPAVQRPTGPPVPGTLLLLVVALACVSCSTAQAADTVAGQARVSDGDTMQVRGLHPGGWGCWLLCTISESA